MTILYINMPLTQADADAIVQDIKNELLHP